jgi:hypothetical protein
LVVWVHQGQDLCPAVTWCFSLSGPHSGKTGPGLIRYLTHTPTFLGHVVFFSCNHLHLSPLSLSHCLSPIRSWMYCKACAIYLLSESTYIYEMQRNLRKERKYVVFIESKNRKLVLDGGATSVSLAVGQIVPRNQFFWSLLLHLSFYKLTIFFGVCLLFCSYQNGHL